MRWPGRNAMHKYVKINYLIHGFRYKFQSNIKKCMRLFEDATRLGSLSGLFSTNEAYDEVGTNDLKYLLLPFFLGQLSQKLCGGDRNNIVEVSEVYFG